MAKIFNKFKTEKLVSDGYDAFLQDQAHVDWRLFCENFEWWKVKPENILKTDSINDRFIGHYI